MIIAIKKGKRAEGILISYCFLIFVSTVLNRPIQKMAAFNLELFRFVTQENLRKQFISNIVMFIPIGFLLSFIQQSVIWGVLFTALIELLQFIMHRGLCEIDDIISNSAGVILGFAIFRVYASGVQLFDKKKHEK